MWRWRSLWKVCNRMSALWDGRSGGRPVLEKIDTELVVGAVGVDGVTWLAL